MTGRLATLVAHETRLQYRYGIYGAYAFVVAFYLAALAFGAGLLPPVFIAFVVYSDPAVLGFFFLGALMMLEKAEGVRFALSVSPVSASDYFWAKAAPLALLGIAAVAVMTPLFHGAINWPLLLVAVLVTSLTYIGIGVPIALRFHTVTGYLIGSIGVLLPVILPAFLAFLDPMPVWAMLVPTAAQLRLMMIGTGAASDGLWQIALMLAAAGIGMCAATWYAIRRLETEIGRK